MEINKCVNCMEDMTGTVCQKCGFDHRANVPATVGIKWNTLLHGRYLIGKILGQGGFGITYIGFDLLLNIKVAVKEYFPMGLVTRDSMVSNQLLWNAPEYTKKQREEGCERFLKEARKTVRIDQIPGIVRVRDIFFENQTAYIVMDFIEGVTLKTSLLKKGAMKYSECLALFLPLIDSMAKVHKQGLIHRDISPDNIMVQLDGRLSLLDMGAAKDITITHNGTTQMVTKRGFSPPEQYMESGVTGTWTDVYAMCATIYYCITGRTVPDAMDRLLQDNVSFDLPLKEALPKNIEETLRAGLALKAGDRIQTMEELADRLFVKQEVYPVNIVSKENYMPDIADTLTMTKKEFFKLPIFGKQRKSILACACMCYFSAIIDMLIAIGSEEPFIFIDAAIMLVCGLFIQLKKSRPWAIGILVYSIINMIYYISVTGNIGGWLIVVAGVIAVKETSKLHKAWKEYQMTGLIPQKEN